MEMGVVTMELVAKETLLLRSGSIVAGVSVGLGGGNGKGAGDKLGNKGLTFIPRGKGICGLMPIAMCWCKSDREPGMMLVGGMCMPK